MEGLKEPVNTLIIKQNRYFEEVWGASDSLLTTEAVVEPFEYHITLVDKVKLLIEEFINKKYHLASAQISLSKVKAILDEAN